MTVTRPTGSARREAENAPNLTAPVQGRRVELVFDDRAPGVFGYDEDPLARGGLFFRCPCGCGRLGHLNFNPAFAEGRGLVSWDGNVDRPTIAEPIAHFGRCTWRGRLEAGVWTPEPLDDETREGEGA